MRTSEIRNAAVRGGISRKDFNNWLLGLQKDIVLRLLDDPEAYVERWVLPQSFVTEVKA